METSYQTETQRTREGQNNYTRSSENQQCHAHVNVTRQPCNDLDMLPSRNILLPPPSPHKVPIHRSPPTTTPLPQTFQPSVYNAQF